MGFSDSDAISKAVKFHTKTVFTWVETPQKAELKVDCACSVKLDAPPPMRMLVPLPAWNTVGQGVMNGMLSLLLDMFANAFKSDYENWAKNKAYRDDCTKKGVKLTADLK